MKNGLWLERNNNNWLCKVLCTIFKKKTKLLLFQNDLFDTSLDSTDLNNLLNVVDPSSSQLPSDASGDTNTNALDR